jgi:hypothetical protein
MEIYWARWVRRQRKKKLYVLVQKEGRNSTNLIKRARYLIKGMSSCHVVLTGTHLITQVKQRWAR